jgi:hypothetical protein
MSSLSSGTKNEPSKKLWWKEVAYRFCFHVGPFLDLFFDPEDEDGLHDLIFQNTILFATTAART